MDGKLGMKDDDFTALDLESRVPDHELDAVTENRAGTVTSVCFTNVTTFVGAGVLGLASAMSGLGWIGGVITFVFIMVGSWYTFYLIVLMHEEPRKEGETEGQPIRRFNHYRELARHAWGEAGVYAMVTFQSLGLYGVCIAFTVLGGQNMMVVYQLNGGTELGIGYWVLIFAALELFFTQIPNLSALQWVSWCGVATSAIFVIISVILSAMYPTPQSEVSYEPRGKSGEDLFWGIFTSIATFVFAFAGHNTALEVQATLPAGPYESTIPRMLKGLHRFYIIMGVKYYAIGFAGYAAYGNMVQSNVLDSIGRPVWAICIAHLCVFLNVLVSYQIKAMALLAMIEMKVSQRVKTDTPFRRVALRVVVRTTYLLSTTFFACLIPFFGDLMSLIGAIAITPTTFVIPTLLWLHLRKPSKWSPVFWFNWFLAITFTVVAVIGAIASVRNISRNVSTYEVFSGFS